MKIEKIAENKIRIILDSHDLEEKNIDLHTFMSDSIESQDLFLDMLEEAEEKIAEIEKLGFGKLPVCIAKTQYSLSDDQKNLECLEPFEINVQDIILKAGSEFVVAITGKIMTMPGLPRVPAAEKIDLDENGNIVGIF